MLEGSDFTATLAAAAAAAAAASSRFRLNNPGESSAAAATGDLVSDEKNLEGAVGADAEEGVDFDAGEGAVAEGAAAAGLGFVKKPRISIANLGGRAMEEVDTRALAAASRGGGAECYGVRNTVCFSRARPHLDAAIFH